MSDSNMTSLVFIAKGRAGIGIVTLYAYDSHSYAEAHFWRRSNGDVASQRLSVEGEDLDRWRPLLLPAARSFLNYCGDNADAFELLIRLDTDWNPVPEAKVQEALTVLAIEAKSLAQHLAKSTEDSSLRKMIRSSLAMAQRIRQEPPPNPSPSQPG